MLRTYKMIKGAPKMVCSAIRASEEIRGFPKAVKFGRSEYVIERHFVSPRTVTDAIYEILRVEDSLPELPKSKNTAKGG